MKKNVPKLRFKDENGNVFPEWELKLLSDILFEHKTRNLGNTFSEVFSVAKTKGIINQIEHLGRSFAGQDTEIYKVVFPFDIVYTKSPTSDFPFGIIKQNKLNRSGIVSVLYGVFRPSNQFIGFILDSYFSVWQNTFNCLSPIVQKGAKNTINIGNDAFLQGIRINLPSSLPEQKKIADFLSAIDERIEYLTKKKELLEQYKRGVMQKIFSQKLRFKDESGKPFPKWENISARSLFASISNKSHESDLPILAATQENGMQYRDQIGVKIISSDKSISTYKIVEKGDFVISLRSFQGGIEYSQVTGICSPAYTVLKPLKIIHDHFYRYYFKKDTFITQLNGLIVGIRDGKQISYEAFSTLTLPYPSLPEQKKIADFLTAIDDKIEHVTRQLEKTTEYKKGLLQQMFV